MLKVPTHEDPVVLRNQVRDIFISRRSIEEQKVNKWINELLSCPKERVLDRIPFSVEGMSLQTLVPEWYVDKPNKEICAQQLQAAREKIDQINQIIYEINKEGIEEIKEYKALYERG